MRKKHYGLALAAALAALFCVSSRAGEPSGLKSLDKVLKKSAKSLAPKLHGKVCVLDFSANGDLLDTSEFGQTVSNMLASHLAGASGNKFSLVGRYELIKIMRDSALFGDPDTIQRLTREAGMDVLVSGEYSSSGARISLSIKAVEAGSGKILASASVLLDKTADIEKMMAHKFRQLGAPQEKAPDAADPKNVIEVETGVYYEGGDGRLYPVREGMVLTSEDNYAVYFKPRQDSYVYVLQIDSANKAFKLFPNAEYSAAGNPARAFKEQWLPEKGFLFLDKNPGREEVYIFASRTPLDGLEKLKDATFASVEESIRLMGVGGRRGAESVEKAKDTAGSPVQLITRKLTANGGFYYRLSFIHR
jgi:hypothetical protein